MNKQSALKEWKMNTNYRYINFENPLSNIQNSSNLKVTLEDIAKCKGANQSFFARAYNQLLFLYKNNGRGFVTDAIVTEVMKNYGISNLQQISGIFKANHSIPEISKLSHHDAKQLKIEIKLAIDLLNLFTQSALKSTQNPPHVHLPRKGSPLEYTEKIEAAKYVEILDFNKNISNITNQAIEMREILKGKIALEKHDPEDLLRSLLYTPHAKLNTEDQELKLDFARFLRTYYIPLPKDKTELETAYKAFIQSVIRDAQNSDPAVQKLKVYSSEKPMKFYLNSVNSGYPNAKKISKMNTEELLTVLNTGDMLEKIIFVKFLDLVDSLIGEHQKLTDEELKSLITLFDPVIQKKINDKSHEQFGNTEIVFGKELTNASLLGLLEYLVIAREKQLELLNNGNSALTFKDHVSSNISVLDILSAASKLIVLIKITSISVNNLEEIIARITENSIPRYSQELSDCLYPDCVLYDKSGNLEPTDGASGRTLDYYKTANQVEGPTKGFIARTASNILVKADWINVETIGDRVFLKGDRRVCYLAPDGTPLEAKATFDLSPLGKLNRAQANEIFGITSKMLQGSFELLDRDRSQPLVRSDIDFREREGIEIIEERFNQLTTLGMNKDQIIKLREIAIDFCTVMTNEATLALLSVGHERAKPQTI